MSIERSLLDELMRLGERHGHTLYSILRRNAGWGVQWYQPARIPVRVATKAERAPPAGMSEAPSNWEEGLVVYGYHPSFEEALRAEGRRFLEVEKRAKGGDT